MARAKLWLPALVLVALVLWSAGSSGARLGKALPAVSFDVVAGEGSREGDRVSLAAQRGKVVLLDYWASFCAPCRASVGTLNALQKQFSTQGLVVYGINGESLAGAQLAALHTQWGFAYPTLADPKLAFARDFRVAVFPTLFLFDRAGKLREVHKGRPEQAELERKIIKLIH